MNIKKLLKFILPKDYILDEDEEYIYEHKPIDLGKLRDEFNEIDSKYLPKFKDISINGLSENLSKKMIENIPLNKYEYAELLEYALKQFRRTFDVKDDSSLEIIVNEKRKELNNNDER